MATVRGVTTLLQVLRKACHLIVVFGPTMRFFVPAPVLADFDLALAQILASCAVLEAIDWEGDFSHPT